MKTRLASYLKTGLQWALNHPAEVFVVLSVSFGVAIIFRMAPLTGSDEFTHFPRAYQVQEGQYWEKSFPNNQYGGQLPNNIAAMVNDYRDLSRKSSQDEFNARKQQLSSLYGKQKSIGSKKVDMLFGSDAVYPPWSFLPSIVGITIAKVIHAPLIWYVYLARLMTLFVWIALVWEAIRLLPQGKWFLFTLALLPTSITQSATVGIDGLLNGVSWIMIALVFAILAEKVVIKKSTLYILFILAVMLCVIKQGYWLIAAWPMVIPSKYFFKQHHSRIWKILTVLVLLVVSILFALFSKNLISHAILTPRDGVYINSANQLSYVLHNPAQFIYDVFLQPFTKSYDTVFLGFVGILTNRLIYLSVLVITILYLGLFLSFTQVEVVRNFVEYHKRLIICACAIIVGTYFLVSLGLYLDFTQVGSSVVEGVVGRYFLPVIPLLIIFPTTIMSRHKTRPVAFTLILMTIVTIGLLSTLYSLS